MASKYFTKFKFFIIILFIQIVLIITSYLSFKHSLLSSFSFEKAYQTLVRNSDDQTVLFNNGKTILQAFMNFRDGILEIGAGIVVAWITSLIICSLLFFKCGKVNQARQNQ